uniref:Uncharacterized protein n=1 Tax=Varanus komodoensis TaxID=61221 RepID=A0A8D2Q4G2_VARKO
MWDSDSERTPKRARPASPADAFRTPEKPVSAGQAGGLQPRLWDVEQLCTFLWRSGFQDPELLSCFRGEREKPTLACLSGSFPRWDAGSRKTFSSVEISIGWHP